MCCWCHSQTLLAIHQECENDQCETVQGKTVTQFNHLVRKSLTFKVIVLSTLSSCVSSIFCHHDITSQPPPGSPLRLAADTTALPSPFAGSPAAPLTPTPSRPTCPHWCLACPHRSPALASAPGHSWTSAPTATPAASTGRSRRPSRRSSARSWRSRRSTRMALARSPPWLWKATARRSGRATSAFPPAHRRRGG